VPNYLIVTAKTGLGIRDLSQVRQKKLRLIASK
jgi:hypothetical protein